MCARNSPATVWLKIIQVDIKFMGLNQQHRTPCVHVFVDKKNAVAR